jgi:iron(III) transport system ATP-binding protein
MSVNIEIKNATKRYGNLTIIEDLSLLVKKGEFFTLLGPSGCGKTTLLRMIAGFNSIEGGTFYFGDQCINDMPPSKRNIGMVFQNYAIFPHLSVFSNVAFGLQNRKTPKLEVIRQTEEILEVMQISEYAKRMPEKLSGGQQQRVALARAIVIKPNVLLMDEPLSNLDAKLRVEMRVAIRNIQKEVGITTVYVTHDQEEAMSISDRIAVMKEGKIQQIGTPQEVYLRPANIFVASFIGRTNLIEAKTEQEYLCIGKNKILMGNKPIVDQNVIISIRPEEFEIAEAGELNGEVIDSMFLGLLTHYRVKIDGLGEVDIVDESNLKKMYKPKDQLKLSVKIDKINIYNQGGVNNITKEVLGYE